MKQANNWFVITGGPSTGKTTIINQLERLGYDVVPEAAREIIDEALAKGISLEELRADELKFQNSIFNRKIQNESKLSPEKLTFLDRGLNDTIAYLKYYGFTPDQAEMNYIAQASYKTVFVLEPLEVFAGDYARTEDADFNATFTPLLFDAYSDAGIKTVMVSFMPVKERLKLILQTVKTA